MPLITMNRVVQGFWILIGFQKSQLVQRATLITQVNKLIIGSVVEGARVRVESHGLIFAADVPASV